MADATLKQKIRASEAQVAAFLQGLDAFLQKNLGGLLRRLKDGDVTAKEAAQLLGQVFNALEKAGLQEEIAKLRKVYADELHAIKDAFKPLVEGKLFSDADRDTVEALITTDLSRVSKRLSVYTDDIRANMMRSVLVGEKPDWSGLHEVLGARLLAGLSSELNTSIQAFYRTITIKKAKEVGFDLFIYLGPDDNVTRPFCEKALNGEAPGVEPRSVPIYRFDEIEKMDNGQGLPVMTYCGGYNCRHQWRPVSEETARARGYG